MPKIVIGLVGPIASGKGTIAKILEEKGYKFYSLSEGLKEEVQRRGLKVSRYNCNLVSNDMRQNLGADILAKMTAEIIERDNPQYAVIDAIRNPREINYLRQKFNARIIGVVADQKKRYKMFFERGTFTEELKTWEQFKELDDREMAQVGEHKQQVKASLNLADFVIENNGTIEELSQKVENFISKL